MRENCREQALEKYDLGRQTEKYIELYEKVLANSQKNSP
jgi:hypothetical protein